MRGAAVGSLRAAFGAAVLVAALGGGVLVLEGSAGATSTVTLYVSTSGTETTGCSGPTTPCETLQEGVDAAESAHTGDVVTVVVAAGAYTTHTVGIAASAVRSLTIQGAGASGTRLTAREKGRGFSITAGTVTISGLTIAGGTIGTTGGGVYSIATTTLADDTISHNHSDTWGGGVVNRYGTGTLTLVDDTISTNVADVSGGGVMDFGTVSATDDTFSADQAGAGGGLAVYTADASTADSIFSDASCAGSLTGTYDVTTTGSCNFGTNDKTVTAGAIGLSALAGNTSSGPETMAIGPSSAAYELVPRTACTVTTDERGKPRPGVSGANCDAGAYEYQVPTSTAACIPDTKTCESGSARPGRSTTLTSDEVTATTSGRGTLEVGTYRRGPAGTLAGSTGKYFGLSVSTGNEFTTLTVNDCNLASATALYWWNDHAWEPVLGQGGTTYSSTCITVTLGKTSTPKLSAVTKQVRLSRFGAVVFGVAGYPSSS